MIDVWDVTLPKLTGEEKRRAYIYVPQNALYGRQQRFPVLYMFDGHNVFFDETASYGKCWGMKEYLEKTGLPLIVASLDCNHHRNHGRLREYSPYVFSSPEFGRIHGRGKQTLDDFCDHFKPLIDERYPTLPDRAHTFIAGSSMGGLMAAYAVVHWNWLFSKAACVSPSLGFVFPSFMTGMRKTSMSPDTRVYLSWGTLEGRGIEDPWVNDVSSPMYRSCHAVAQEVRSRGGTARLYCQIGGHHCEADWEKQAGVFMPFLWQGAE